MEPSLDRPSVQKHQYRASPFHLSQWKLVLLKQTRLMTEGWLCRLPLALFHLGKGHELLQSSVCASENLGLPCLE